VVEERCLRESLDEEGEEEVEVGLEGFQVFGFGYQGVYSGGTLAVSGDEGGAYLGALFFDPLYRVCYTVHVHRFVLIHICHQPAAPNDEQNELMDSFLLAFFIACRALIRFDPAFDDGTESDIGVEEGVCLSAGAEGDQAGRPY
jgi:hypothetical protein